MVILPQSIQIDPIDVSIYGRLCTWSQTAEYGRSEIEPPRPLPSIGLSHLPVRKRFELLSRFNTDVYGKSRTKPREASEIRRVTDAWNTPACSSLFLLFVMYTRRQRIPSVSKRTHDIPTMKDSRLPVFALTLISMEGLDQGCDRRVESDFNTDSYKTVLPNLGRDGECRKRPSAHASARLTLHRVYKLCPYKEVFNRYTETRAGWGSVGDGRLRMRPPAGFMTILGK